MTDQDMDFRDPDTTCSICYAEFLDPEDLTLHLTQVHLAEDASYRCCQFCKALFNNLQDYAYHLRDVHIVNMKFCPCCTRAFNNTVLLHRHEKKHRIYTNKNFKSFSCSQCRRIYSNVIDLERHEYEKHNNDNDGVMLHEVFSILSSILNIKASKFLQSLHSDVVYVCVCCKYSSNDARQYIQHLQEKKCVSLVCDKCSNVYGDRKGLIKHLSTHKECWIDVKEEDCLKTCPHCLKKIKTFAYKAHANKCKPIKCSICDIILRSMYELSDHQSKQHPMAITMKFCSFCHREFVGNVALEKHIERTHKKDFPLYKYRCVHCENIFFKHPKDLFGHYFSTHKDIQPFSCKICDKTFKVRKSFTIHIKLEHNSQGFVEFDENYKVFFAATKSDDPFIPTSFFTCDDEDKNVGNATETEAEQTDIEAKMQTDKETDSEMINQLSEAKKKPPKIRFKEQKSKDDSMLYSDFMNSEIENQTENEGIKSEALSDASVSLLKERQTRKRKRHDPEPDYTETEVEYLEEESDDEPLSKIQKKGKKKTTRSWNMKKIVPKKTRKQRFTCNVCHKNCYTFQNYNHHISLHAKDEVKKCIICSSTFKSSNALKEHIEKKHSSSKLTETLKNLLERRKLGKNNPVPELTPQEKFRKTIKKVRNESLNAVATLKEIPDKLSVQTFIENFVPEDTSNKKQEDTTEKGLTIKTVKKVGNRRPFIKMTKFTPLKENKNPKLAMPVRFKSVNTEPNKVNIKLIQKPVLPNNNENIEDEYQDNFPHDNYIEYEEDIMDTEDKNVPEVAEEVLLEQEEQKPAAIPHKLVIPNLNTNLKQIRIAHLLPEAPYFKIVKMDEVIQQSEQKVENIEDSKLGVKVEEALKLPGGTKLVNVNPLAHLIGDQPIEKFIGTPSKYYKSKKANFGKAIAKAFLKLEKPVERKQRRGKKSAEKPPETEFLVEMNSSGEKATEKPPEIEFLLEMNSSGKTSTEKPPETEFLLERNSDSKTSTENPPEKEFMPKLNSGGKKSTKKSPKNRLLPEMNSSGTKKSKKPPENKFLPEMNSSEKPEDESVRETITRGADLPIIE